CYFVFFFFQAEDGIRDLIVTGVQTCALPIYHAAGVQPQRRVVGRRMYGGMQTHMPLRLNTGGVIPVIFASSVLAFPLTLMQWVEIGRASCRERVEIAVGGVCVEERWEEHGCR